MMSISSPSSLGEVLMKKVDGQDGKTPCLLVTSESSRPRIDCKSPTARWRQNKTWERQNAIQPSNKRLSSRAGLLDLQIPQVRPMPGRNALEFYPQSLERACRAERADSRSLNLVMILILFIRKLEVQPACRGRLRL